MSDGTTSITLRFSNVFYEPTDVPIAIHPFTQTHWNAIKYISPNLNEIKEIAKHFNFTSRTPLADLSKIQQASILAKFVAAKVPVVIVTVGDEGVIIARKRNKDSEITVRHYPVERVEGIVNVSGAGDCFAAGFICGVLNRLEEECCVKLGFEGAKESLMSQGAVPDSFEYLLKTDLKDIVKAKFYKL